MQTKSNIQIMTEILECKSKFANNLEDILEYNHVEDNVFLCTVDGDVVEILEGYYGEQDTYDTLQEAMEHMDICSQGIRIHQGKFSLGKIYRNLADVPEGVTIDLREGVIL